MKFSRSQVRKRESDIVLFLLYFFCLSFPLSLSLSEILLLTLCTIFIPHLKILMRRSTLLVYITLSQSQLPLLKTCRYLILARIRWNDSQMSSRWYFMFVWENYLYLLPSPTHLWPLLWLIQSFIPMLVFIPKTHKCSLLC